MAVYRTLASFLFPLLPYLIGHLCNAGNYITYLRLLHPAFLPALTSIPYGQPGRLLYDRFPLVFRLSVFNWPRSRLFSSSNSLTRFINDVITDIKQLIHLPGLLHEQILTNCVTE
jgi:hypothetical protein